MKGLGTGIVAVGLVMVMILMLMTMLYVPDDEVLLVRPQPVGTPVPDHPIFGVGPGDEPARLPIIPLPVALTRERVGGAAVARGRAAGMVAPPVGADVAPAYVAPKAQLAEGHWQGLEAIPLTQELRRKLRLPETLRGLLIDEVTLNAAQSGMLAGDVLVAVNGRSTTTLLSLLQESKRVQGERSAVLTVIRRGQELTFTLRGNQRLGFAQVETAPMILAGDIAPHPYRGACTGCHAIGTTGHMVPDPDGIMLPPPPIRANARSPHRDRGSCRGCHTIIN